MKERANSSMDIAKLLDFLMKLHDKTDLYWHFYLIFIAATFGWLLGAKNTLETWHKIAFTFGYCVFVVINVIGLYNSYDLMITIFKDIKLLASKEDFNSPNFIDRLKVRSWRLNPRTGIMVTFTVHLIGTPLIMFLIWRT